jgi:hypothetical protein
MFSFRYRPRKSFLHQSTWLQLIFLILLLFSTTTNASWSLEINERGLPLIKNGGKPALQGKFSFWGEKWKWAGIKSRGFEINGPLDYSTTGTNKNLNFTLKSKINKTSSNQMNWAFELDAQSSQQNVVGGGIVFKLDVSSFLNDLGQPVLLPGNEGWQWGDMKNKGITVRFEPALKTIYFDRNRKSDIHAFFYKSDIPKGKLNHTMTVTLSNNISIKPTMAERFDTVNSKEWPEDSIDWQTFPIDLSFMNAEEKPAGKRGFVRASGDRLLFEDNTQARFWGTNITANTLFRTSKENISKQSKRLSSMGFNLVRLHHHDSAWVNPNIFGKKTAPDTQHLSESALDKLDWWIKCLKEEGIYIWLDLHVGRTLTAQDNIFAFDEIHKNKKKKGASLKGYNYVNLSIKNAMKRFNQAYVSHINPYTKLAYKDDAAIIAMLITNENDITNHFGNSLLPNKKVPEHNKNYMREAKLFAAKHGLPENKTWLSWTHGPSKLFLNDLEHRFNDELISDLRKIGVKVPIVTTSTWGYNPLASLPALTAGDMIDAHAYGGVLELEKNPAVAAGMTSWMAAAQVTNKPISITEWNVSPFPTLDRHTSSLLVASKANHQGWDALMQYAYSQGPFDKVGRPSNWHSHNDPAFLATLPAAALLYRKGHVQEANTVYYFAPGDDLFNNKISPATSATLRTSSEIGKLLIAMPDTQSLPWLEPSSSPDGSIIVEDPDKSFIEPKASSVTSDTGELYRNWDEGIYSINTKQSQAVMGWVGSKTIQLADTEFNITTRNATVAIQSLDNKEINQSRDILITLAATSLPGKNKKGQAKLPFLSEPVKGTIKIYAPIGLHLHYIDDQGDKTRVPVNYINGQYTIELDKLALVHWLSLAEN